MMEPVQTSTMHISETKTICSTLSCTKNENDEISKKLEDELLYGVDDDDDADEDDALSDDSLRLRLSDDEVDGDDNETATSCPINNQLESVKTESPDTGSYIEASGSSFEPENFSHIPELTTNETNDNKDTIIKLNLTNDNDNNKHFYNNINNNNHNNNNKSLNLNNTNFFFKNVSYQCNSDNFSKSNYGNVYYNNPYNFGRSRKIKTITFSNNNLNDWSIKKEYSSRSYSSNIREPSTSITIKPNVSAELDTSKTAEFSNEVKVIDENNDQDNKSHFNNNNFTKAELKVSDAPSESNAPLKDVSLINANSDECKNLDEIKTCDDDDNNDDVKDEDNAVQHIDELDKNKSPVPVDVNIENENVEENKKLGKEEKEEGVESGNEVEEKNDGNEEKEIEEEEENCLINKNTQNDAKNDINDSKINVTTSNDNIEVKRDDDADVKNDEVLMDSSVEIKIDDENEIKIHNQQQKLDNDVLKEESIDNVKNNDDITLIQDKPSENNDVIEKSTNKRRLSESDEETNACKKVMCEEKTECLLEPEVISDNVIVTICKRSDEVPELIKILESDEKKSPDVDTLRSDYINGDSCSTDLETVTMSMETTMENESCQKDECIEKNSEVDKSYEDSARSRRRRKRRKTSSPNNLINQIPIQEKENVRQRRETAQKAQEMIRKLNNDSDSDAEDSIIKVAYKGRGSYTQSLSPPTLKRGIFENEDSLDNISKKPKNDVESKYADTIDSVASGNKKTLDHVRKFFLRDSKQQLAKLTQEQLEELLIQKVIETITMRDEIGKLREQARISERNQEATRVKCQQLAKQIKDFEMVLTRFAADRRVNEKSATPIKINRSVGLQVSFITDGGIQNLRQLNAKNSTLPNGLNTPSKNNDESVNNLISGRKGIKVRSPRRPEIPVTSLTTTTSSVSAIPISLNSSLSSITPAPAPAPPPPRALVVSKSIDNRQTVITTAAPPVTNQSLQTITLNGIQIQPNNSNHQTKVLNVRSNDNINSNNNNDNSNNNISATINTSGIIGNSNNVNNISNIGNNSNSANLIDLTGEEEKNKFVLTDPPPLSTIPIQSKDVTPTQKTSPRYQRIVQPPPPNVTIPPSTIRVIQPDKPAPTAIVNNMNTSRLTLVMKGQHQLLIANPNQIRPVLSAPRPTFPGITYTGVQTIPNGSVRVVPTSNVQPAPQKPKHPAALPAVTNYPINPSLKLPPPAPSLKISKVPNGIVLSWNMALSDRYADIASYQLYAYQEVTGMAPSTTLWRKVGDVRALALPMACTLTQFTEGNNYYFAVRAVDRHSRLGQYSQPGSISL